MQRGNKQKGITQKGSTQSAINAKRQHAKRHRKTGNLQKRHHVISSLVWWDHPQIDGNFPLLLTLHEEPLKPERHLGKDVPISKVNQLGFPAGKKFNRCQFRFGLVVIINQGTPKVPNKDLTR